MSAPLISNILFIISGIALPLLFPYPITAGLYICELYYIKRIKFTFRQLNKRYLLPIKTADLIEIVDIDQDEEDFKNHDEEDFNRRFREEIKPQLDEYSEPEYESETDDQSGF